MATTVGPPELLEVATGVWAYVQPDGSWMINNTGLVTADAGFLMVDTTSTEARNRALLGRVAEVAGTAAPRALVNTHHHGDHTYGNWLLPAATPVIGHVYCREDVLAAGLIAAQLFAGPDYGQLEIRPPDVTFSHRLTLHLGSRQVELIHVGPAHTRSDVLAWLPDDGVVFAGDLAFNGGQPFLLEGSLAGFLRALAAVRALEADVLVPGHGPVCRGSEIARVLDDMTAYAEFITEVAAAGHRSGRPPLAAAQAADPGRFGDWQEAERLVGNLHRAYSELDGEPLGTRIPLPPAVADMTRMNGGPITCLA